MDEKISRSWASLEGISGTGIIRLPDSDVFNGHRLLKNLFKFFKDKPRYVFRGRTDPLEERQFVKVFMVEKIQDAIGFLLEDFKIDTKTGLVEFICFHRDLNLPIVAMEIFTITLIIHKIVSCGKMSTNHKAIH